MSILNTYQAKVLAASPGTGSVLDREAAYLRSQGYSGTLRDMRKAYSKTRGWSDGNWVTNVATFGFSAFDLFANSAMANDSGDGLSAATAKKTLAAAVALVVSGKRLGLVTDSTWREAIVPPANMTVGVSGAGAMPIMDGADVAGTWTLTGTADVWTQVWTRPGPIQGSDDLGLWIDGVRPRFGLSVADIAANGGWWNDNPRALTANVYVKVAAATNPNSDGKLYEISKRNNGFNWHAQQSSPGTYTVNVTGPIELKRYHAHYGCVSAGAGNVSKLLLRDCGIHHMVTMGTSTTDCVAIEYLASANGIPFVSYRADGTGFSHTFTRCHALFPGGASRVPAWNGFYSHASLGNTKIDAVTWNGCTVRGMDGMNCSAVSATGDGCYIEDCNAFGFDATADSNTFTRCLVNDTVASANSGGNVAFRKPSTTNSVSYTDCASYTRLGGAVTCDTGTSSYTNCAFVSNGNGISCTNAAPASVNYSIFDSIGRCYHNMGLGYTGNNNVFYFRTLADQPWLHWNGVLYTTLASFQAASGQDSNSVYLLDVDQTAGNANAFWLGVKNNTGGPASGDFRINPTAKVYAANGTPYFGTFPDGKSLSLAGPQTRRNFNTSANVAGPPTAWPVLPTALAGYRQLVNGTWTY